MPKTLPFIRVNELSLSTNKPDEHAVALVLQLVVVKSDRAFLHSSLSAAALCQRKTVLSCPKLS